MAEVNIQRLIADLAPEQRKAFYAELSAELARANKAPSASEQGAVMGMGYQVGNLHVPPLTLGAFAVLEFVRNTMVCNPEATQLIDLYEFFYVCTEQKDILPQVTAFARAKRALEDTKDIAATTPDHYRVYLDHMARVQEKYLPDWEQRVKSVASAIGDMSLTELGTYAQTIIADAMASFSELAPDDVKKKEATAVLPKA